VDIWLAKLGRKYGVMSIRVFLSIFDGGYGDRWLWRGYSIMSKYCLWDFRTTV